SERLNTSSNNIFLIGDSAGGNLCAVTCIKARNSGIKNIKGQILIYPLTNLADLNTESYKLYDKGYLLSKKEIEWFRQNYIPNPDIWSSPDASPLLEKDLSNLPSALIITAQFDILHDEGAQYAEKLKKFGNVVEHIDIKGVTHGFMSMDRFLPQTNLVYNKIQEFIFRILNTNQS
ncbi:MAG: alpha/beta hydrolase, partial [Candidatus Woesearchaeota archaeon]